MVKPRMVQNILQFDPNTQRLHCSGELNLSNLVWYKNELSKLHIPSAKKLIIDGTSIKTLDSAGAWLLNRHFNNMNITFENFTPAQYKLLHLIKQKIMGLDTTAPSVKSNILARLGQFVFSQIREFCDFLSFLGQVSLVTWSGLRRPNLARFRPFVQTIESSGAQALIIIAMLSLMIGIVMTYQMGLQLRTYGANIYIVDLLGLSILREFAPLLTAIMVAGRTGSAFTAQLGSMKINQEIDALNTMGVQPIGILLIPRIFGLAIALPLLTIWADGFGILGGMLMANNMLDVSTHNFVHRFQAVVSLRSLIIGLGKAPVFALIIATIGCFEGMKVQGSSDSVGKHTTRSVVLAIFFIIIADALFSITFSKLKL
jgi:phospholipid/cholesterol/gamma-HCH transport system permease protein